MKKSLVAKAITVDRLPNCYERNLMARIVKEPSLTMIFVVVNELRDGWEALIGWPSFDELKREYQTDDSKWYCSNINTIRDVKERGDKLSEDAARELFPEYIEKPYRR